VREEKREAKCRGAAPLRRYAFVPVARRAGLRPAPTWTSTIHHSPFTIHHSPFAIRHSRFAIRGCFPFAIRRISLLAARYSPLAVFHHSLFAIRHSPFLSIRHSPSFLPLVQVPLDTENRVD
jgi:hypothetical protein